MSEVLTKIRVRIDESSLGDFIDQLTRRNALVDDVTNAGGLSVVVARAPDREIASLKSWVQTFTQGRGNVETVPTDASGT